MASNVYIACHHDELMFCMRAFCLTLLPSQSEPGWREKRYYYRTFSTANNIIGFKEGNGKEYGVRPESARNLPAALASLHCIEEYLTTQNSFCNVEVLSSQVSAILFRDTG
jgi:hypothetical protein